MQYRFAWDPAKEAKNIRKHGVNFRQAATVFRDPNQITIYDEEHSEKENRWITLGLDERGILLVVVHNFRQVEEGVYELRIISSRKATAREQRQYREFT